MKFKSEYKMKPWVHFVVSIILATLLYPIFNWNVLFVIVGGFLIDIDHYFWYLYKYKKFNIFHSYKFYLKNIIMNDYSNVMGILLIFHTIEFLLFMLVFSYLSKLAMLFTIGLLSHFVLDTIFVFHVANGFIVNHSIIYWIIKNKIQKV